MSNIGVIATIVPLGAFPVTDASHVSNLPAGSLLFANNAALAAYDFTSVLDGTLCYVASYKAYFSLDKTSTIAVDTDNIIAATGGGRLFRRLGDYSMEWVSTPNWWIDTVAGNDENPGTALLPLKSGNEVRRRLYALRQDTVYTVNTTGNFTEADPIGLDARLIVPRYPVAATTPSASMGANGRVFWRGQRIVLAAGTFTANGTPVDITDGVTPGGAMPTVTDSTITDWTPYVGKLLVSTSGATSGTAAIINKDLLAGVAGTQEWRTIDSTATTGVGVPVAPPLSGTTYDICDHNTFVRMTGPGVTPAMTLVRMRYAGTSPSTELRNTSSLGEAVIAFTECHLDLGSAITSFVNVASFLGVYIRSSNSSGMFLSSNKPVILCSISGSLFHSTLGLVICNVGQYAVVSLSNTIMRGGFRTSSNAMSAHIRTSSNTGFFDCTGTQALVASEWGMLSITGLSGPFGNNNIRGIHISRGGRCVVFGPFVPAVPTLKGTAGDDLRVGPLGISTYVPALTGGAPVPAAASMKTWAEFYAAPFSGVAVIAVDQSMIHGA